jgi:ribosomal protein S26
MPTYTFAKVELRATKSVKCDACGKRLKRSTTLFQTLSPFNKTADGELKSRAQIMDELRVKEQEWRGDREWCTPCFDATHIRAKDLAAGDVLESKVGDFTVVTLEVVKGYGDTVLVNAGQSEPITFRAYDRVVIKPRTAA